MRNLLVVLGFFAFVFQSRAQVAPDFTVTDIDGQVHHLYADYLNQGKTVMIKIMFTTCPPCHSIAPFMEPLYQGNIISLLQKKINPKREKGWQSLPSYGC